jgi:3-hydroxyisobutyrate dehydrogenase
MKIGFIGLGTMGAFMAANLQRAGYQLLINDIRREAGANRIAAGAIWAETPQAVAEQCEVVFTSLPGPKEVEAVVFGPQGLLAGIQPGAAYFDLSTNAQSLMRRVGEAMAEKGAFGFDAPVSGGPKGAETGQLAIWVGGDKAVYERCKPVLDAIGDQAAHLGPIGSATVAKLVHNMAGYAIQVVMAEVFSMGVKGGMDPLDLWAAVRQGAKRRLAPGGQDNVPSFGGVDPGQGRADAGRGAGDEDRAPAHLRPRPGRRRAGRNRPGTPGPWPGDRRW